MWSDGSLCFSDFRKRRDFCLSGFVLFHLAALSYIIVLLACKYYGQPPAKFRWGQSNVNKCAYANDVSKQSHPLWYLLPLFLTPLGLWELCLASSGSTQPRVQFNCLSGIFSLFYFIFFPCRRNVDDVEIIQWNENNRAEELLGSILTSFHARMPGPAACKRSTMAVQVERAELRGPRGLRINGTSCQDSR